MATVRVTIRPGTSSITNTSRRAAWNRPMASARAAGGQPSEGAIAMAVAVAGSSIRSTTITGRSKAADSAVAVAPAHWTRSAPLGSSSSPSGRPAAVSSRSRAMTATPILRPSSSRSCVLLLSVRSWPYWMTARGRAAAGAGAAAAVAGSA